MTAAEDALKQAKDDYDRSMSMTDPILLFIIGLCTFPFGFGILLIIGAIVWALIKTTSRAEALARLNAATELVAKESLQRATEAH